jgi:hypothetical protein
LSFDWFVLLHFRERTLTQALRDRSSGQARFRKMQPPTIQQLSLIY